MPNYCSNSVQFHCTETELNKIIPFFEALAAKATAEQKGQLPHFVPLNSGHMSGLFWNNNQLHYETRWCPNIEVMQCVGDYFGIDYTHSYEEVSNLIYGYAEYKSGILTELSLSIAELEAYTYDEEKDKYLFEGGEYENDYKIMKILLARKKKLASINYIKN